MRLWLANLRRLHLAFLWRPTAWLWSQVYTLVARLQCTSVRSQPGERAAVDGLGRMRC